MNDFLHNLRNNKDKRFDRNRRPYDSNQYPGVDRANGNYRKKMIPRNGDLTESLPAIKKLLEDISENQKRIANAEERKATALERIADHFFKPVPEMLSEEQPVASPAVEAAVAETDHTEPAVAETDRTEAATAEPDRTDAKPAPTDREKTVALIRELRAKGLSFEKVARELQAQGIPTVSGRGIMAWAAGQQTGLIPSWRPGRCERGALGHAQTHRPDRPTGPRPECTDRMPSRSDTLRGRPPAGPGPGPRVAHRLKSACPVPPCGGG